VAFSEATARSVRSQRGDATIEVFS